MAGMSRWVVGVWAGFAVALLAPSVASAAPNGIAAGWRTPAAGTMYLTVLATPDPVTGAALRSATAKLGGVELATESFVDGTCSVRCPASVVLAAATLDKDGNRRVPDGDHLLVVIVEDVNGEDNEILHQMITVDNRKHESTSTVTVQIGSGNVTLPQPAPGGSVGGESGPTCRAPQLSMRLAERPLRYRRGVPVLAAGRTYRYAGRVTCRINGRRRAAPRGLPVQVRNRLRGSTVSKPSIDVRKDGDVVARLAYQSSRVVIFRVVGAGGDVVSVRIPIRVVRVKKARR